jgi:CheY-like chemotaxis protein
MSPRTIKLLHIDDNVADRLLVAKLLSAMKDYTFQIARAATEITALQEFAKGDVDCVLLDYRLPQGDGISCTRKLRQRDPLVPILALTGVPEPELEKKFLQAGADEVLHKEGLTGDRLARSIRQVLSRADILPAVANLVQALAGAVTTDWIRPLEEFVQSQQSVPLGAAQLQRAFEAVCAQLDRDKPPDVPSAARVLRPFLLELILRVAGNSAGYVESK